MEHPRSEEGMLKSLKIDNFRCFPSFELAHLGRINLLVGKNNSGKTSILEAIQLLTSSQNLGNMYGFMLRRGEYFFRDKKSGRELAISNLFYGHELSIGSSFSIAAINDVDTQEVRGLIEYKQENSTERDLKNHKNIPYFKINYSNLEEFFYFPLFADQRVIVSVQGGS
jgi:predicted ATP-dependent endonuclease of OLD family